MRCLHSRPTALRVTIAIASLICLSLATGASASAATTHPGWELGASAYPTSLPPGGKGYVVVSLYNVGGAASTGAFTVTDALPPGLTAIEAGYYGSEGGGARGPQWSCRLGKVVTCTNEPEFLGEMPPGELANILIVVEAAAGASGSATNHLSVVGGGAPVPASSSDALSIGAEAPPFGLTQLDGWFTNADGTLDTQAGSHPYELNINFALNNIRGGELAFDSARAEARNVTVNLPPGVIGNPTAAPQCTAVELLAIECPADTQIGVDFATLAGPLPGTPEPGMIAEGRGFVPTLHFPVYNMVPPPGVPAQFGFSFAGVSTHLDAHVRSGSDYGISEHVDNLTQREIVGNSITIWGVPAEPSHNFQRCARSEEHGLTVCGQSANIARVPFLTLPTSCEGPQRFSATVEPWDSTGGLSAGLGEASFESHESQDLEVGMTGCDHLSFNPSIAVAPDTAEAETPTGLTVEVKTPQEGLANVNGLAAADIKNTTVTLPEGMAINPGQAAGLQACQASEDGVGSEAAPACPNASKVGEDEIQTPLLGKPLRGEVYVLQSNPPNLQLLVAASGEGVNLKLIGDVHLNETTGRLTTTFGETPELPFTVFRLSFSGGARAALTTPARCGSYAATSDFTPWGTPAVADAFPRSEFAVSSGPDRLSCTASLPFDPVLSAGSTTDQAGGYTDFSLLLSRADGQQPLSTLQFKTPEGLLGMISKVPLRQEPQAAAGTCSPASQIGHTVVEAGPGPYPLVVPQPGQPPAPIYLTGGYKGAPYGLSIVVPLVVGPFTLQTQVVRARIEVDPHTAQLTITTDPLPSIIDGIPADLRTVNAVVDRAGFMFNPTNCEPQSFSGVATLTEGAQAPIASHFQMGSCRSLKFKPNFKVSTSGKTSRADGASLDVKILYPTGPLGANQASSQANIAKVKVELPKQLPSRLTTLQKACPAATFEANPATCPAASVVGHATAVTPLLPVELTGPAYFVSHGGEAFPSLIVVLQGYGVIVDLVGSTFISKKGITSSTFKQVPDVPITSFELALPEGPFSALAANGNLCRSKLQMPTDFVAQNGAVFDQATKLTVTGCSKAKRAGHKKSARRKAKRGGKRG